MQSKMQLTSVIIMQTKYLDTFEVYNINLFGILA